MSDYHVTKYNYIKQNLLGFTGNLPSIKSICTFVARYKYQFVSVQYA